MHTWYRFLRNRVYVFISVLRWRYRHGRMVRLSPCYPQGGGGNDQDGRSRGSEAIWGPESSVGGIAAREDVLRSAPIFFCGKFSKHISPDGWGTSPWVVKRHRSADRRSKVEKPAYWIGDWIVSVDQFHWWSTEPTREKPFVLFIP